MKFKKGLIQLRNTENKTGVRNDPLGQPIVPAGCGFRLILNRMDGHLVSNIVIIPGHCGRPRGSIFNGNSYVGHNSFLSVHRVNYYSKQP